MTPCKPFPCAECARGTVSPQLGVGRVFPYDKRGERPVPDDFPLCTCNACGETYVNEAEAVELHRLQTEAGGQFTPLSAPPG